MYYYLEQGIKISRNIRSKHANFTILNGFSGRVIQETKIPVEIKRTYSRDKDQTWKTDKHNKEHKITKIIHTK